MLGALIDLKIRHETDNQKSLNDVMRFLNRWFAERGVGFEEHDIERACTAISNYDFSEFFARHVYGTMDPPMAEYLAYAGVDFSEEVIECSFPFTVRGKRISGRFGARASADDEDPGPRPRDVILTANGEEFEDADSLLKQHVPGDVVKLTLERGDETHEFEVELEDKRRMIPTLSYKDDATRKELRIREAWLTSVN